MPIQVELPDSTLAEFPDGTSDDVIKSTLGKHVATQKRQSLGDVLKGPNRPNLVSTTKGGPPNQFTDASTFLRSALPEVGETLGDVATHEGVIKLPQAQVKEGENKALTVGKEAYNIATSIPDFLSSGPGILSAGAGALAPAATGVAFTANTLKDLGNQILESHDKWDKYSPTEKTKAITDIGGTALMGLLIAKGTAKGARASLAEKAVKPVEPPANEAPIPPAKEAQSQAAVTPENASVAPVSTPAEVPLGLNRPEKTDPNLSKLSDDDFASHYRTSKKAVDTLEKQYDAGTLKDRQELADAQDKWSAADNERFKRNIKDIVPEDLFRQVLNEPRSDRQRLIVDELTRQKASLSDLMKDFTLKSPDEAEAFKGKLENLKKNLSQESTPVVDQTVNNSVEATPATESPQKFKIGNSPQTHSLVEKLPQTEVEKANGEQPIKVKNDKTGQVQTVMESDLTPVKDRTGETKAPKRDLDAELKAAKLDPDSFPDDASKRAALKRAKAMSDPSYRAKAETLAQKLEGMKIKSDNKIQKRFGKESGAVNFGIAEEIWNKGIDIASTIVRGGGEVVDAIEAFISHVKSKLGNQFDEDGARNHLAGLLSKPETTGIAARISEEREKTGAIDKAPESGESIGQPNYTERGRELITRGVDPQFVMEQFKKTGKIDADDIAVVRAHEETLAKDAKDAASTFGIHSDEYEAAKKADNDWLDSVKKMQSEWARAGHAQQGETDIDTGNYHGLQREFHETTGKDFTPKQEKEAQEKTGKVAKTQESLDKSKQELNEHLDKETGGTKAEQRALDAANKTVREAAARAAKAEETLRNANAASEKAAAKIEDEAAKKALAAASKTVREAAARLAKADAESQVRRNELKTQDEESKANQAALDAANKTVRESAARQAKAEEAARVAKSASEKLTAENERKAAQKAVDLANKMRREAAIKAAQAEAKNQANPGLKVWAKVREYLDKGEDNFDNIRNKIATDLGMTVKKVSELLTKNPTAKRLAYDVLLKQRDLRRFKESAKRWLQDQSVPWIMKIPSAIRQEAFNAKVLGHVSVGLGTHSPMLFYQPQHWARFFTNYGRMWKLGLSPEAHEMVMQDLTRRPNWSIARVSGLENDPFQHEEYNLKGLVERVFPNIAHAGNRAYDVLKLLRQDLFDDDWNKLPQTLKTKAMAQGLASDINHVTGIVQKSPFGRVGNSALFAPRLLVSRFAWAYGDPAKAASTGIRVLSDMAKGERNVSLDEKALAIRQLREKATVVATTLGMLAANAGLLKASGSKQKVNFDDPTKSDWLKFKAFGLDISFGNAMLTTMRLPFREAAILLNNTKFATGKKRFEAADRGTYEAVGEYFRNQLNPAVGDAADLAFQTDAQGRPLPWSRQKVPAYLQRQGIKKPYTWGEYARDAAAPIPLEEPMKQVFDSYGMPKDQAEKWTKIIGTAIYMGGTGGRISEDTSKDSK